MDFKGFPKIPRVNRIFGRCGVSEKIDGTNAHVLIDENGIAKIGSRKRWIEPGDDNFGFAKWVMENETDILQLGYGHHFGEWYGEGIQKNPLQISGKRWALFNYERWNDDNPNRPECCECVPKLYSGDFTLELSDQIADLLKEKGSHVEGATGEPEGFIIYLSEFDQMMKWTFDYTEGKWSNK